MKEYIPSEYMATILAKMKDGWSIGYDIKALPFPDSWLQKKGEKSDYLAGWVLDDLWRNKLVKLSSRKQSFSVYKLNKLGKSITTK